MARQHWLLKTEPETYSFAQLQKEGKTSWNGVRNFQARNFLRQVRAGDIAIIYHSGDERAAVGLAKVTREAYPDPDPKKPGDWVQVDLAFDSPLPKPVSLAQIKKDRALAQMKLLKQSRLSCSPVSPDEFARIRELAKK